jgi:hypothetical protein
LNPRCVRRQSHQPAERINLARNLSFSESADSWVAAHLGYRVLADSQKAGFGTDSRGCMSGLAPGMTPTYNNAIKLVNFRSLRHLHSV